jgi:hypothetical protein
VRCAAVTTKEVRVGDLLWVDAGAAGAPLAPSRVGGVERVWREGMINPLTMSGTVVVEGVAVSSYNDMLGSEARMHALCGAWRLVWRVAPRVAPRARAAQGAPPPRPRVAGSARDGARAARRAQQRVGLKARLLSIHYTPAL